jgi:membrane protein DedA with SNARE-associated domain
MFESVMTSLMDFVRTHSEWAVLIVFLIAFGECLAFLSFLVPATVFFTAFGTFAGAANMSLLPLSLSAGAGGALGFWVSYEIGRWYGPSSRHHWPFTHYPDMLERGETFFNAWGSASIFFGHFFGPVRGVVALAAGILEMPRLSFQLANLSASFLWGFALLYGTGQIGSWLNSVLN